MSKTISKFSDTKTKKQKFYSSKLVMDVNNVDNDQTLVSAMFLRRKNAGVKDFRYFIGYKNDECVDI